MERSRISAKTWETRWRKIDGLYVCLWNAVTGVLTVFLKDVHSILERLQKGVKPTEDVIRATKVGQTVAKLRGCNDKAVSQLAKDLVQTWKSKVNSQREAKKKECECEMARGLRWLEGVLAGWRILSIRECCLGSYVFAGCLGSYVSAGLLLEVVEVLADWSVFEVLKIFVTSRMSSL